MRLRARVGLAMYWCRPNDPGGVVQCCRKDTQKLASELRYNALRDELGARGAERKRWKAIHKITRTMGR